MELKILDTPTLDEPKKKKRKQPIEKVDKVDKVDKKKPKKQRTENVIAQSQNQSNEPNPVIENNAEFADDVTSNILHLVSGFVDSLLGCEGRVQHNITNDKKLNKTVQKELSEYLCLFSNRVQMGTLLGLNTVKGIQEAKQIKQNKKNERNTSVAIQPADPPKDSISDGFGREKRERQDLTITQHVNEPSATQIPIFQNNPDIPNGQDGSFMAAIKMFALYWMTLVAKKLRIHLLLIMEDL